MLQLSLREETVQIGDRVFVMRELAGGPLNRFLKVTAQVNAISQKWKKLNEAEQGESAEAKALEAEASALEKPLMDSILIPQNPAESPTAEWYSLNISERIANQLTKLQVELNGFKEVLGNSSAPLVEKLVAQVVEDLQLGQQSAEP